MKYVEKLNEIQWLSGKPSCENWNILELLYLLNVDMGLYLSFAV
jgi:hypothetical protein